MQTQAFQLTLYLPDDVAQPAVALPKPDRPRVRDLFIREAAIQYLGELPDGEKPVTRLVHYGAGALATDELLACVFGHAGRGHGHADAQHLLSAFEGLPGLACATIHELQQHPGIGPERAAQVKAAWSWAGDCWWPHPTSDRKSASRPTRPTCSHLHVRRSAAQVHVWAR